MIVESPWKASIEPKDVSPASFVIPGGRASRPKTKRVPAVALPRSVTTTLFTKRKNFVPAGTTKTKKANRNCSPIPQPTTRQFTTFRLAERSQANPAMRKIPKKLTKL